MVNRQINEIFTHKNLIIKVVPFGNGCVDCYYTEYIDCNYNKNKKFTGNCVRELTKHDIKFIIYDSKKNK